MFKRISCLLMTLVLFCGLVCVSPVQAQAASEWKTSDSAITLLKEMEGFSKYPYYDYLQYSVGYGTRCPNEHYSRYCTEGISEEEADQLLRAYLEGAEKTINGFLDNNGVTLNQNQFDALILFSYNCGSSWVNENFMITRAVLNGTVGNDFIYAITLWCNAGGQINSTLVKRRLCEANIYLNGVYSNQRDENFCYVTYNAQGGKMNGDRIQGYDANAQVAPMPTASYEGRDFLGWYTLDGQQVTVLTKELNGHMLFAHWSGDDSSGLQSAHELPDGGLDIVVTSDVVNVRLGPGTSYSIATSVEYGQKLTITQTFDSGDYIWGKSEMGWISLYYTNFEEALAGAASGETVAVQTGTVVNTDNLRVRSGPGESYSIVGALPEGTRVEITEQQAADGMVWGKISSGWISMEYVQMDVQDNSPQTPETTPPETDSNKPSTEATQTPSTEATQAPTQAPKPSGKMGTIFNASALRIRSSAGTGSEIVGYLSSGYRVEILEETTVGSTPWGRISSGWISMDYVRLDSTSNDATTAPPAEPDNGSSSSANTGTVIADALCVRSGAGTGNGVTGILYYGDRVEILATAEASGMVWGQISGGWVSLTYVQMDTASDTTPDAAPDTTPEPAPTPDNSGSAITSNTGTVTAFELCVRSGAGTGNSVLGYLYSGTRVEILETKIVSGMMWGRISSGWISLDYVRLDSTTSSGGGWICSINTDYLNVRQSAGTDSAVVDYLLYGNKIEILEQTDVNGTPWGRTAKGWICLDYVI